MPIDKRDSNEGTRNLTKVMWTIVIGLIFLVFMAFVAGFVVHYIVEFFMEGWDLVR